MRKKSNAVSNAYKSLRGGFIIVGLFSLAINVMMLAGPLYMLQVYDRVLTSKSFETLIGLSVLVAGIFIISGLLDYARICVLHRLGARFEARVGHSIFDAVMRREVSGKAEAGESFIDYLSSYRDFISSSTIVALFDTPWVPIYLLVLFALHPYLGLLGTAGALVLFFLAFLNDRFSRTPLQRNGQARKSANGLFEMCARNAEALLAMGMNRDLRKRWTRFHTNSNLLKTSTLDRIGGFSVVSKTFRLALQSAMLGLGAGLAIFNESSPGVMIAATIILSRALAPIDQAIGQWRLFSAASGSFKRMRDLLSDHPAPERHMSFTGVDEKLTVSISQAGPPAATKASLSGINFELVAGDVAAIIGPSGSGKSTLSRLLVGVWHPQRGEVLIDGVKTTRWNQEELGRKIGYLPQEVEIFSGSIRDNISRFSEDASDDDVLAAALDAGVHEMIMDMPEGYDTIVGPDAHSLSGGERQRLGLARALYGNPFLLVLDEPNANLDATGDVALRQAVKTAQERGAIVVVVTHRPSTLDTVNKVLILEKGQQRAFGPKEEILKATTRSVPNQKTVTHLKEHAAK